MYLTNANFTIHKQIGELSKDAIIQLKTTFSEFPEVITPNPVTLILKKGAQAIVIAPDQISFVTAGSIEEINIEEIYMQLQKVNHLLNLSDKGVIALKFESLLPFIGNSMEKSIEAHQESAEMVSAIGIGYRFIVNKDNITGDVHIEPLIKDSSKLFFNVVLQSKDAVELSESIDYLRIMFEMGTTNSIEAARKLLSF
jgi:hypothetical protein